MPPSTCSREPITATRRIVPPYLYAVLWNIAVHGPLTAQEIADDHNRPASAPEWLRWTAQQAANRLRTAQKLGLVERDDAGFWLLTPFGRNWMSTGADG